MACVCVCAAKSTAQEKSQLCTIFISPVVFKLLPQLWPAFVIWQKHGVEIWEKDISSQLKETYVFVCLFVQGQTPTLQDYNTAAVLYYTRYTVPSEASWHPASSFCWFTGIFFLEKTNQSTRDRTVLPRLFRLNTAWSPITMLSSICRRWRQNTRGFRSMLSKQTVQPDYF